MRRVLCGVIALVVAALGAGALGREVHPLLWLRLLTAFSGGASVLLFCQAWRPKQNTTHGSAAFAERNDIADLLQRPRDPLPPGGILLGTWHGRHVVLPRREAQQHGLICGGTGFGKTFSCFFPNAALAQDTSLVLTDPKGELWEKTSGYHRRARRYAPLEPDASEAFNWIPLCKDQRLAELCARAIVEAGNTERTEQIWIDAESAYLSALFAHASTLSEPTPLSVYHLFTRQRQSKLLAMLMESESAVAREQALIFRETQEKMRGSIVPAIAARLQFLREEKVARFTSASLEPPDFGMLRRCPMAFYWSLREQDIVRLRPLTSVFFSLLLEGLAGETLPAEQASVPVVLLLDEFANIGVIPHFETTIALARGRGTSLWLGVQSLSQLTARYGRENARTIVSNCATKVTLPGLDTESAEFLSRALGMKTMTSRTLSWHRRGWISPPSSVTNSPLVHPRALLTSDEVRRLPSEEMLVLIGNRRPLRLRRYHYALPERRAAAPCQGEARAALVTEEKTPLSVEAKTISKCPPPFPEELVSGAGKEWAE